MRLYGLTDNKVTRYDDPSNAFSPLSFFYLLKSWVIYFVFPFMLQAALQDHIFLAYTIKYLK